MDKETFISLIERHEQGQTDAAETALLEVYLQRLEARGQGPEASFEEGEQIWQRVQQQINPGTPRPAPVYRQMQWWWAAAAIGILLAAGGIWWQQKQQPAKPAVAAIPAPPGTHKAVLTLADGSSIVLDDAADGPLASQGNASIVKSGSSTLAYTQGNNGAASLTYNTLTIPRGTQFKLILADGSRVWLNAASHIRYPTAFPGNSRIVEVSGEAYFEVAADASRPFEVVMNHTKIQVLGTSFNINGYAANTVNTTLVDGRIAVAAGNGKVILKPGQQAVTREDAAIAVKQVDTAETTAWKNGFFLFKNAGVREIMDELARWYDITIIYKGNIPDIKFEGEMQRSLQLPIILKQLEQKDIRFKLNGKILTVEPE